MKHLNLNDVSHEESALVVEFDIPEAFAQLQERTKEYSMDAICHDNRRGNFKD